jgi:thiol-disulfide isomerase/thioredoxin
MLIPGVLLAAAVAWLAACAPRNATAPPVAPGTPMPRLEVAGWLNLPPGESFDPTGKIVVVDLWATYCGPCRAEIPRLARIAAQYRPLGVEFIGLTDETERDLDRVRGFIDQTPGFDWPVGYGAIRFMAALNITRIPTVIVFGKDGRAIWSNGGTFGLEAALDAALAKE